MRRHSIWEGRSDLQRRSALPPDPHRRVPEPHPVLPALSAPGPHSPDADPVPPLVPGGHAASAPLRVFPQDCHRYWRGGGLFRGQRRICGLQLRRRSDDSQAAWTDNQWVIPPPAQFYIEVNNQPSTWGERERKLLLQKIFVFLLLWRFVDKGLGLRWPAPDPNCAIKILCMIYHSMWHNPGEEISEAHLAKNVYFPFLRPKFLVRARWSELYHALTNPWHPNWSIKMKYQCHEYVYRPLWTLIVKLVIKKWRDNNNRKHITCWHQHMKIHLYSKNSKLPPWWEEPVWSDNISDLSY